MKRLCVGLVGFLLFVGAPRFAMAQSDLGLKGAGVHLGIVNPEDMDATFGFGAFADLGTLAPNLRLSSHLDYWSESEDAGPGEVSVRDLALGMRGRYMFPVANPRLQPYAGAGVGLHFLRSEVDVPGFSADDSDTKLGIDLGGGLMAPMTPNTDFLAELWYGIVDDFSQLSLRAGLSFKL